MVAATMENNVEFPQRTKNRSTNEQRKCDIYVYI
jgi:hypothetical protein